MYAAFGDESHDEASERVYAVAGLFGDDNQWAALEDKWLQRTEGRVFHAADCETDHGVFSDRPHQENQKLYKDLTILLAESRLMGFGAALDMVAFQNVFVDHLEEIPYYKCFREVIVQLTKHAYRSIPRDRVKFTFDQRLEIQYNAAALYQYMAQLPESDWECAPLLFEELSFASRKAIGIQAADLLARETMKHLDNMIGPVVRPMRRSMATLRASHRFGFDFYMREYFEDFSRKFQQMSAAQGLEADRIREWLTRHKLMDNHANRLRYLIELDASARSASQVD